MARRIEQSPDPGLFDHLKEWSIDQVLDGKEGRPMRLHCESGPGGHMWIHVQRTGEVTTGASYDGSEEHIHRVFDFEDFESALEEVAKSVW